MYPPSQLIIAHQPTEPSAQAGGGANLLAEVSGARAQSGPQRFGSVLRVGLPVGSCEARILASRGAADMRRFRMVRQRFRGALVAAGVPGGNIRLAVRGHPRLGAV